MLRPNVLIVDDHQENLFALRAVLDSPQYDITECQSGKEALECLLKKNYDLILMDVQMPGLDGFATAKLIKSRPQYESIPLIFVSAIMLDDESTLKGYDSGGADYIIKPFHPDALRKKVQFFLTYGHKIRMEQHILDSEGEYERFMKVFNELINPLWSVLLNVQMLKKYGRADKREVLKRLGQKLESIEVSTKRLQKMIVSYKSVMTEFKHN